MERFLSGGALVVNKAKLATAILELSCYFLPTYDARTPGKDSTRRIFLNSNFHDVWHAYRYSICFPGWSPFLLWHRRRWFLCKLVFYKLIYQRSQVVEVLVRAGEWCQSSVGGADAFDQRLSYCRPSVTMSLCGFLEFYFYTSSQSLYCLLGQQQVDGGFRSPTTIPVLWCSETLSYV